MRRGYSLWLGLLKMPSFKDERKLSRKYTGPLRVSSATISFQVSIVAKSCRFYSANHGSRRVSASLGLQEIWYWTVLCSLSWWHRIVPSIVTQFSFSSSACEFVIIISKRMSWLTQQFESQVQIPKFPSREDILSKTRTDMFKVSQ